MNFLEEIFLFDGLEVKTKQKIINTFSKPQRFQANEVIYSDSNFPTAIGIVIKGKAYAVTNNGGNVYMNNFEKGDCFGVAAIFGGKESYVSSIISKTDTEILFISEEELKRIFNEFPQISVNYIKFLSEKIRFLNLKLGVLSSNSAETTVYNYLSTVTDSDGFAKIPKSMTLLSRMLGLGRASLYRSLDTLEANGKILRENNKIKVIKNEKNS